MVELLAATAMIGILSALALVGYRRWISHARVSSTKDLIHGIMLAQKFYYDETGGYLSCSSSFTDYYPATPDGAKRQFHNPGHSSYSCWRLLNADVSAPIYVGVAVVAGPAGTKPSAPSTDKTFNWPVPTQPWFVVQAATNVDNDSDYGYFIGASFSPNDIYVENEYE